MVALHILIDILELRNKHGNIMNMMRIYAMFEIAM